MEINKADHCSTTIDLWSSHGMKQYMSYTIHFITTGWELKAIYFQTQFLPEDHTGTNIAYAMLATLKSWG